MGQIRIGDKVRINAGRRSGLEGKVTEINDDRVNVSVPGLPYEISYLRDDVQVILTASKAEAQQNAKLNAMYSPEQALRSVTGEKKQRLSSYLVQQSLLCPSFPYSCSGECGVKHKKIRTKELTLEQ